MNNEFRLCLLLPQKEVKDVKRMLVDASLSTGHGPPPKQSCPLKTKWHNRMQSFLSTLVSNRIPDYKKILLELLSVGAPPEGKAEFSPFLVNKKCVLSFSHFPPHGLKVLQKFSLQV